MQILLANAKMMTAASDTAPLTEPSFQTIADTLALEMAAMDTEELERQLDCSKKLAAENWNRYQNFFTAAKIPAIMAYNGQAYKHLRAKSLTTEDLEFAQKHLWII